MRHGLRSSADTATRRPTAPGRGSSPGRAEPRTAGGAGVVWTLIVLILVAGAYYAVQANAGSSSVLGWSLAGGVSSGPVKISGFVRALHPGAHSRLRVKAENESARAVAITRIWARAGRGAPGCPSRTLRIGGFTGRRLVGSGRTWRLRIPIAMRPWAGDACQGASYPLFFFYRARR